MNVPGRGLSTYTAVMTVSNSDHVLAISTETTAHALLLDLLRVPVIFTFLKFMTRFIYSFCSIQQADNSNGDWCTVQGLLKADLKTCRSQADMLTANADLRLGSCQRRQSVALNPLRLQTDSHVSEVDCVASVASFSSLLTLLSLLFASSLHGVIFRHNKAVNISSYTLDVYSSLHRNLFNDWGQLTTSEQVAQLSYNGWLKMQDKAMTEGRPMRKVQHWFLLRKDKLLQSAASGYLEATSEVVSVIMTLIVLHSDSNCPITCIYAMMSHKTQALHEAVFEKINDLAAQFAPLFILADFEADITSLVYSLLIVTDLLCVLSLLQNYLHCLSCQ